MGERDTQQGWAETAQNLPNLICWAFHFDRSQAETSKRALDRHLKHRDQWSKRRLSQCTAGWW